MEITKSAQALGIEAFNKQAMEVAEGKAMVIVDRIVQLNACIKKSASNIADYQKELNAMQNPEISEDSVLGATLPVPENRNPNQFTIALVIEKLAKGRQGGVEAAAHRLTEGIIAEQARIAGNEKKIEELRKELLDIKVEVVTVAEVAGN